MLDRLGYRVTIQNCSVEALSDFRRQPDTYDLVITDLTMPMMTGLDLANELHKTIAELPIILMTGYSESITSDSLYHHGIDEIIEKPIELRKLATVIRKSLDK